VDICGCHSLQFSIHPTLFGKWHLPKSTQFVQKQGGEEAAKRGFSPGIPFD
jgi:hypothetical protein